MNPAKKRKAKISLTENDLTAAEDDDASYYDSKRYKLEKDLFRILRFIEDLI